MSQTVTIGSSMEVPVECLGANFEDLIKMLTVANPEAKTQAFFGTKFGQNKVVDKLRFYSLNKAKREILLPRNIDRKYFPNALNINYTTSRGTEISEGFQNGSFTLRPHQADFFENKVLPCVYNIIYNNTIKENTLPIDILMNAECGSGKTAMSLYLASLYGRKTLVAVTKKVIGEGFISTVKQLFPQWSVGWEKEGKEFDITIATYSLLSGKNYDEKWFSKFGHVIMDEYHRAGAESYQIILSKAPCQYRTTITATFRRKDGLHKILRHHVGEILELERTSRKARIIPLMTGTTINEIAFRTADKIQTKVMTFEELKLPSAKRTKLSRLEEYTDVCVKDAKSRVELSRGMVTMAKPDSVEIHDGITGERLSFSPAQVTFHKLGTLGIANIDNEIIEISDRNEIILELIKSCVAQGRKVLVLSKRKKILYTLHYRLKRYGYKSGVVASEKSKDYIDYCKKLGRTILENREEVFNNTDVILGISQLAEEGMDVPWFDTIVYLHPVSDIEQSIGRVTREKEGKPESQGIYLRDNITPYEKAWTKKDGAKAMFEDLGHIVERPMTLNEYKEYLN